MKISVIGSFSSERKGDPWREWLDCYRTLADEVVLVYDYKETAISEYLYMKSGAPVETINMDWPEEYSWSEFPRHNNAAYKKATGDWVLRFNVDYFMNNADFRRLREELRRVHAPVITLNKFSIYGKNYFSKGNMPMGIYKKIAGDVYAFGGVIGETRDDLDGIIVYDHIGREGVPMGKAATNVYHTHIPFWNFDYTFKPMKTAHAHFSRMARAHNRYFQTGLFGRTNEEAIELFRIAFAERKRRATQPVNLDVLPEAMRERYVREVYSL